MFFKILLSLENGVHTPHTYNMTEMQGPPLDKSNTHFIHAVIITVGATRLYRVHTYMA